MCSFYSDVDRSGGFYSCRGKGSVCTLVGVGGFYSRVGVSGHVFIFMWERVVFTLM